MSEGGPTKCASLHQTALLLPPTAGALSQQRACIAAHACSCTGATRAPTPPPRVATGGWKMKLALARAMLLEAGLLLLDEPTNHMDASNVKWLQHYLLTCGITLITVSHDSGFLDTVCTGIIHYENKKLVKYKGNLSKFVEQKPEAKAYYELTDEYQKFNFPLPGPLDGVKCAPSSHSFMCSCMCAAATAATICVQARTPNCSCGGVYGHH
jgi:ABC-type sulfate/molybdate transport systems ATPase subunit